MVSFSLEQSVASVVAEAPRSLRAFQRHHIDTRCAAQATLARACRRFGVHPDDLLAALEGELGHEASAADAAQGYSTTMR